MHHPRVLFAMVACLGMRFASAGQPSASSGAMPGMNMPGMNMPGMNMSMPKDASTSLPTAEAYTVDHRFLIKLRSVPRPIPFEKYFTLQIAVYDAREPASVLPDAHVAVTAGMRHGLETGFAHGMQSTPQIAAQNGTVTVSGLYFHMAGPWTLKVDVEQHGRKDTAYLTLPCCGP